MMATLGPYELNSIITGDARELAKAIPDESVDLVLTDPPFGIDFKYSNGYDDDPAGYMDLIQWLVSESNRIIRPGGYIFIFQSIKRIKETWGWFPEQSRLFSACKNFVQGGHSELLQMYDPVVYWKKQGRLLKDGFRRDWHVANTSYTNRIRDNDFHDCPRPLDTILYMVDSFCVDNGIALDFFMGSGTTALAAKITGRRYIGFEIDPPTAGRARERVRNTQPPLFVVQPEQAAMELSA